MGLSLLALGATLIFVGALSFREILLQESKFKKTLGWILGVVFVILGVVSIVADVKAEEELEYRMCVYYSMTNETICIHPTNLDGCTASKKWFQKEAKWHNMNRYCCVHILDKPNECLVERTGQQTRLESLLEHTEEWDVPGNRPVLPTIDPYPEIKE